MKERLSESEKIRLKDKLSQNGEIPTPQLLEKLSGEISHNFKGEQNPGVYQESIKRLLRLKEKVNNKQDLSNIQKEINNLSSHLSEEKKKEFLLAIRGAKEILKNSRDLISDIKNEINIFSPNTGVFTTKLFGQKNISRGKNPQNISDQFIGGGIGLFNSGEAVAKISISLMIGIGKTIPDVYKIVTGKAKTDAFKEI